MTWSEITNPVTSAVKITKSLLLEEACKHRWNSGCETVSKGSQRAGNSMLAMWY